MTPPVDDLIVQAQEQFAQANDAAALENAKAKFLGKQGALTAMLKGLAQLDPEQKKAEGARINQLKQQVERSEEHTSELQSLMRISYAVFCLKKKINNNRNDKN